MAARVLDLGCGSGMPVAHNLLQHGIKVTGIDASPTMIALCQRRMPEQEWIVGDMRKVKLGRRFDGILAWDSFFFLKPDDQRSMFKVFAAHAAATSVLMFDTDPGDGQAIGEYRGEPLYHAGLDAAEYQTLLAQSGFDVVAHAIEDPGAGGRTVLSYPVAAGGGAVSSDMKYPSGKLTPSRQEPAPRPIDRCRRGGRSWSTRP